MWATTWSPPPFNPRLTVEQVRLALQATATPVTASNGTELPFWQVGYRYADLGAAVTLVSGRHWDHDLPRAAAAADRRVLGADGFQVSRSDFWTYDAPRLAAGGSDSRTFETVVPETTTHLKVTLSHPSLAVANRNNMTWSVTVRDAANRVLGTTTERPPGRGPPACFSTCPRWCRPSPTGTSRSRPWRSSPSRILTRWTASLSWDAWSPSRSLSSRPADLEHARRDRSRSGPRRRGGEGRALRQSKARPSTKS